MFLPLDKQFDLGFGSVADAFKEAADNLRTTYESAPTLGAHLPISFLYRHAIELYLKSSIVIFHRKLELPYGKLPHGGEPHILIAGKWRPMYRVHTVKQLYEYLLTLFADNESYLSANTGTDWSIPEELATWISSIEETDSSSTFFRYPVTRHSARDPEKSDFREVLDTINIQTLADQRTKHTVFLCIDRNDEIVNAFAHDNTPHKTMICTLSKTAMWLSDCHAALVGELTHGA